MTTHWIDATLHGGRCACWAATFTTTLPSSADMKVPTPTAASTHHAPGGTGAGGPPGFPGAAGVRRLPGDEPSGGSNHR